ncbi:MAG TPA: hypothetical protein VF173_22380 [Thermoanaerobaculia bacterium]|nr:hypothetical protein [Thermoanaerobaculia bacterium]
MRIKVLLTALVLLVTFQISRSQSAAFAGQQGRAKVPQKVRCKCVPGCRPGYFCEVFDNGDCGCTPI